MEQPYNSSHFDEGFERLMAMPLQPTLRALFDQVKAGASEIHDGTGHPDDPRPEFDGLATGKLLPKTSELAWVNLTVLLTPSFRDIREDSMRRYAYLDAIGKNGQTELYELWYRNDDLEGGLYFELTRSVEGQLPTETEVRQLLGWDTDADQQAA